MSPKEAQLSLQLLRIGQFLSSYSPESQLARQSSGLYDLLLMHAANCVKAVGAIPETKQQALFDQIGQLQQEISEQAFLPDKEGFRYYWASWYSRFDEFEEGVDDIPPFQFWITGQELGSTVRGEPIFTMTALLRGQSSQQIESVLRTYFPDRVMRFCNAVAPDMVLGDRFPNFENRTSIFLEA